jgi:hypothetical protein
MTKKHFIALADSLKGIRVPEKVMSALCAFCRSQNPNFMESRFRDYIKGNCGPNSGKR